MIDSASGLAPAIAAGVTVHLWLGHRARVRTGSRPTPQPGVRTAVGLAGACALAVTFLHGTRTVLALILLSVVVAAVREVRRRRQVVAAEQRAELVLAACEGLASDLRAGQPPVTALVAAAEDWPELAPVAAAAQLGADVPAALRHLAGRPGAAQLRGGRRCLAGGPPLRRRARRCARDGGRPGAR